MERQMTELERKENNVKEKIQRVIRANEPRFKFEKFLGDADNGVAVVMREVLGDGKERRFVLKTVADPEQQSSMLEAEIKYLHQLRYAAHICRTVSFGGNPWYLFNVPWKTGPFYTMEYIPFGTLEQFYKRVWKDNQVLPNRVLWSIFLCVIRSCIGMAYPPKGPDIELERVRPDEEMSGICHYDMLDGNFMFGDIAGGPEWVQEHDKFPPLKIIDFGRAIEDPELYAVPPDEEDIYDDQFDVPLGLPNFRVEGLRNRANDDNIRDAGVLMARLVSGKTFIGSDEAQARATIVNKAIRPDLEYDLRFMIIRCLAVDPRNRPQLEEFQTWIDNGVFNRPADHYGPAGQGSGPESDESIQRMVQMYMLNAAE
ncbi:hypothetical protein F5B19DRAFT_494488 [Rostrohypoxylon terebratum]|nr:hypothetical protein F5B19DRAFT_494488 [Rostrohypoxylon terebratum]